jgi:hypothetical protein
LLGHGRPQSLAAATRHDDDADVHPGNCTGSGHQGFHDRGIVAY